MSTATKETLITMLDTLPDPMQDVLLEKMREIIADMKDDAEWNRFFTEKKDIISAATKKAIEQHRKGQTKPTDPSKL